VLFKFTTMVNIRFGSKLESNRVPRGMERLELQVAMLRDATAQD
jgi:hypothetical protein